MSDKETTVYIIDQGSSMGHHHSNRTESDLDYSLHYIYDKMTTTMEANRKTFCIGIIGLRTDTTKHPLNQDDPSYNHITVQQSIVGPFTMDWLKKAQRNIGVSETEEGDAVSAVVVATMLINEYTKKNKWIRRIVLVTNGRGSIDGDDLDAIAGKLNEDGIELMILGVDFDDSEYGFKEENKDPIKASNEEILKSLCEKCDKGVFGTMAEAIEEMKIPRTKTKRHYSSYKGPLSLGDVEKYGEDRRALEIQVERYFKTKKSTVPSATNFVNRTATDGEGDSEMGGVPAADGLASIKRQMQYLINDETAVGGKRDVEKESLAKGYSYGRTAVPISASEASITKLETKKGFSIIGFVPEQGCKRYFAMGPTCITVASQAPGGERDRMALSSLVHALFEQEAYAVARYVAKDKKEPLLLLLAPHFEPGVEGLVDVELPFQEDIRSYRFPPLDHVLTVSGAVLSKHRNIPTDDLTTAMDAFVDSMDLSEFGQDEDGAPAEYLTIADNFRPDLHRISQGIRWRAVYPDKPIPPIPDILIKYRHPPAELISLAQEQGLLDNLIKAADVKEVPPKAKGRGKGEKITPKSGLDVDRILADHKPTTTISPENAIPDFKQALAKADDTEKFKNYVVQLSNIIKNFITKSVGDQYYERVLEYMSVFRKQMIAYEEPGGYNEFLRELKGKLGGEEEEWSGREELWFGIGNGKLGLVDEEVCEVSDVSVEEAARFMILGGGEC